MTETLTYSIIGYIIGSIPFGYIYAKFFTGVDLREFGSHSTGTTNVLRCGNKKLAAVTLVSDVLKGSLVTVASLIFCDYKAAIFASFFCVIGHVYPVWLKFKGGKGAATTAGTFLVFSPVVALVSAIIWGITAKFSKISSLASLIFCLSFTIITIFRFCVGDADLYLLVYSCLILFFLLFSHRNNINRLIHKEENTF
ncbi:MAG: glycerol-3-phosphate 1-O-acyltransferase PlsY [Holosporales bacterium]|jgi:glycerol-3-phosphate acyltransferase PlsY|nr:glycerol-3-phosphate 1-O-acyltransferase PlsY [Holosporales bacterium]